MGFSAGLSLVTLILMAGMFVLPSAAVEMAKESSAAAAAQVFSKVQQQGRLMELFIAGLSGVILILMAGMFVSPLAAAEWAKESGSEDLAAAAQAYQQQGCAMKELIAGLRL